MDKVLKRLSDRIKRLRKIHKLSQEKLTEKADVHATYIGKIERGEMNPSIVFLDKIAKAFKMNLSELFMFPDDSKLASAKPHEIDLLIDFLKDALETAKRYKK